MNYVDVVVVVAVKASLQSVAAINRDLRCHEVPIINLRATIFEGISAGGALLVLVVVAGAVFTRIIIIIIIILQIRIFVCIQCKGTVTGG